MNLVLAWITWRAQYLSELNLETLPPNKSINKNVKIVFLKYYEGFSIDFKYEKVSLDVEKGLRTIDLMFFYLKCVYNITCLSQF